MLTRILFVMVFLAAQLTGGVFGNAPAADHNTITADDFAVSFFPAAPFYVGDLLSARVTYTGNADVKQKEIQLALSETPEETLATTTFSAYRSEAIFYWAIDTSTFAPGFFDVTFTIPEIGLTWEAGLNLLPAQSDRETTWLSLETPCCNIYYLSGTDAEEDIAQIESILETETDQVIAQFFPEGVPAESVPFSTTLDLVLVPSVVGHGGFATDEAVMTYSHHNWAGTHLASLAHHEIVHVVDRFLNDGPRPSLLAEGLAVYLSGGHYREGPLIEQAAALIELGDYLPLTEITDDFYAAQHETSYIEAGALVAYLVQQWGWDTFIDFYFTLPEESSHSASISAGLMNLTGQDLSQLEADFIAYLKTQTPGEAVREDVRLTIAVYNSLRRYQTLAVPYAHFRTAWWPAPRIMRSQGIVGDYLPQEKSPFNIIMENLLIEIHKGLDAGTYQTAEANLILFNQYLDLVEDPDVPLSHYALGWPLPNLPDGKFLP